MFTKETNKNIKIVRLILFSLGILTIIIGFYLTGACLVQFTTDYISKDKVLTDETKAILYGLQVKILFLGAGLILLSLLTSFFVLFKNYLIKNAGVVIEKTISCLGRIFDRLYSIGTNEKFLWGFIILLLLTISVPAIYLAPAGGFHVEGVDLQQPKNLVKHGLYSTLTTEGFDTETHRTSAGPGILMPIALVFKVFGINVYFGRMVHVAFVIGMILVFYIMVRNLYGKKTSLLALFLSFTPYFIMLSRGDNGMGPEGYIPSLFYLFMGAHFWFKSIESKKNIHLIISGLFFAFAFQTKWLFLFGLFALILTCIILSLSKNSLKSKYYLIPSAMVILVTISWTVFRILNVGARAEAHHLEKFWTEHGHRALGEGVTSSFLLIFQPVIRAFTDNVARINFWEDLQLFLIIPAIIYVIVQIAKHKWIDYKTIFFLSFTLIWFLWWLLFNYDLPGTHLRAILIISQIFVAKLLYDVWQYSSSYKDRFQNLINNQELKNTLFYVLRIAIVIIVLSKVILPIIEKTHALYGSYSTLIEPYHEMIGYIKDNTEKNAIFSGWGWSMPWYLDIDNDLDRINKDRSKYPLEQCEKVPEYFIVSPEWPIIKTTDEWPSVSEEGIWTKTENEKRKKFILQNCTLLKTFGGPKHIWYIYKIVNKNLAQLSIEK